jgi:hypothetical protein
MTFRKKPLFSSSDFEEEEEEEEDDDEEEEVSELHSTVRNLQSSSSSLLSVGNDRSS